MAQARYEMSNRKSVAAALAIILTLGFLGFVGRINGQGTIVYGHFPITSPLDPNSPMYQYDAQGYRLWGDPATGGQTYQMVFNGQVAYTFYSGLEFSIIPSSLNAVIALHVTSTDLSSLVIPLSYGQQIGTDGLGYEWVSGSLGSGFTAARNGGIIGQPPLTIGYFTGLASAYVGLQFEMDGQTYYGWGACWGTSHWG